MRFAPFVLSLVVAAGAAAQPQPVVSNDLQTYLKLSNAQVASIVALNVTYNAFSQSKYTRVGQVQSELVSLKAADTLDPIGIGQRYAEIEAIHRDMRSKLSDLQGNVAKVLTPVQVQAVQGLATALSLQATVQDATCQGFLEAQAFAFLTLIRPGVTSLVLSNGTGCDVSLPFPAELAAYLTITPAQLDTISRLDAAYLAFRSSKQERLQTLNEDIASLTQADSINVQTLGNDYVEIEAINRDLRDKQVDLRKNLVATLTAAQQVRLTALSDARDLQYTASEAQQVNLLPGACHWYDVPSTTNTITGVITGIPSSASRSYGVTEFGGACGL